jgi:hypothetical protein
MKNIKIIFLCFIVGFAISCQKEDIIEPQIIDIFKMEQASLTNKSEITFNVKNEGVYIVTMINKNTNQILSREKIKCVIGKNKIRVYTKTIPSQYLYLTLEDSFDNQLGKTIITTK